MTATTGRHDGDTLDLASSVGATATAVAASRAAASKGPDALLADPWAEPLVRAVGIDHFIRVADGESLDEDDPLLNRRAMQEQMAVRTRFFDEFFVNASRDGVLQAVILASGLDTRAYRLPWPAGAVVFEVDQPEVIEFKTRTLSGLGAEPGARHHTVPIDLREDWPAALRDAGFDPSLPTAWIAEGLLPYLPPEAQDRLFDEITALSAPGSRLATEHMDLAGLPDDWAEKLTERTKRLGSDIDLAQLFYLGERNSAADYLAGHGWGVSVRTVDEAYASNGFTRPDDELASFGANSGYLTATLS
ncbi:SAM-dependent methyltransferase [Mycolicibacterium sediminis]|uniref:S-adenosyl-L-methionine-dependent methyltransferase n=1 Tax=Mycolicibacterium sediminis TaxID=1286180 RepID=A0A7I7QQ24_9MYCO|nr:SAM-dependent methyltransferase [Mycolicibacterium sediminis]BBY28322.1 putative S-adenosyl-L-methionine-dependent methyltransferase [Mycolicibacterium sediminis]